MADVESFYARTIGFPILSTSSRSFIMQAGATTIEFEYVEDGTEPFYHFAFNIPQNKFALAKAWLAMRCPLLRDSDTGADEQFFSMWNAHAVFFHDPAGNIGELIARHTLSNSREGEFTIDDILEASEIGMVVHDQQQAAQTICDHLGLSRYHGNSFCVGDEHGLFILPVVSRPWIPERTQPAAIHPVQVNVRAAAGKGFTWDGLPYRISGET